MLMGNAGIVTAVTSLILTFADLRGSSAAALKIGILVAGLFALWAIASSKLLDRHLSNLISKVLSRYSKLDVKDYANLLHLSGEYRITEMKVDPEDWLANRSLKKLKLSDEGVMVLGITIEHAFIWVFDGDHLKVVGFEECELLDQIIVREIRTHPRTHHHGWRNFNDFVGFGEVIPHFGPDPEGSYAPFFFGFENPDECLVHAFTPDIHFQGALPVRSDDLHFHQGLACFRPI
jgi:hypothetical protein